MIKIYYTLFIKFHRFYSYFGEKDLPHFFSMAFLSLLVYFNITAILGLIEIRLYPDFQVRNSIPILVSVYGLNYFIFLYKKRYVSIIEKATSSNSILRKYSSTFFVLIYVILSIGLWVYAGAQVRSLNLS